MSSAEFELKFFKTGCWPMFLRFLANLINNINYKLHYYDNDDNHYIL